MITVVKRSGKRVTLDISKIQRQVAYACQGIDGVSPSMIEVSAKIQFADGMSTSTIDELLLKAMIDLIDESENPDINNVNYQYVAGRQKVSMLRKEVYGQYTPPKLYDIVKKNVAVGIYTPELLQWYTEEEWNIIDLFLDHAKDEKYSYAAIAQLTEKYLVQNRATGTIYETPQVRYAIAAATAFHAESKDSRLKWVKDYYDCTSEGHFSLATPVLAGLGTNTKQFSSCVLITVDDTLDSIFASGEMMAKYASKRAGIGLDISRIRPLGAPIRGGEIKHTGILPFAKKFLADLRSCCLHPDMYVEVIDTVATKKIKMSDVQIGMQIKTMTPSGEIVYREITDKFITEVPHEDQVRLEFSSGAVVNCSTNHPILVQTTDGQVRVDPLDLTTNDDIITDTGYTKMVTRDVGQYNDPTYLDITVDDTHVFFTSDTPDGPQILTKNSQGGIRNASCTVTFQIWHYQFDDMIVLKNNQGTDETRVRQMDYNVVLNAFFWRRFKNKEMITLFDPHEVPDLYAAFYRNSQEFEDLYVAYESRSDIKKKVLSAEEIFKSILKERTDTGRIYLTYIDNVIDHVPFDSTTDPVYQSNLCLTGDTVITIKHSDHTEHNISLATFVEMWELGGTHGTTVKSKNTTTGEIQWSTVSDAAKTATVNELYEIEDEHGNIIRCTPEHLIFTKNRGYVAAKDLLESDTLCTEM